MVAYALSLAAIAFVLETVARHAHRRTVAASTAGFTYHRERDIWSCPENQHLFPIFSDPLKGRSVYRAPASVCNSCRSKAACTDSSEGRAIEKRTLEDLQYGMQRFHRAVSLTLLMLASLILAVEMFRTAGTYPHTVLGGLLALVAGTGWKLSGTLRSDFHQDRGR